MKVQELIFVYNADSGIWNGTLDVMHKVFSPSTYSCHLCKITYGALSVKSKWAKFIKELPVKASFYHRDEFAIKYGIKEDLPAIFVRNGGQLLLLITANEMKQLNLIDLQEKIQKFFESNSNQSLPHIPKIPRGKGNVKFSGNEFNLSQQ